MAAILPCMLKCGEYYVQIILGDNDMYPGIPVGGPCLWQWHRSEEGVAVRKNLSTLMKECNQTAIAYDAVCTRSTVVYFPYLCISRRGEVLQAYVRFVTG